MSPGCPGRLRIVVVLVQVVHGGVGAAEPSAGSRFWPGGWAG